MKIKHLIPALAAGAGLLAPPTAQAVVPYAATGKAKGITFAGALVTGTVNPHGVDTNFYFQYGVSTVYTATTPLTPAGRGTTNVPVSGPVAGLTAATTYHYRIVAVGAGGTTRGSDRTFTTAKIPLSLSIGGVPNPVLFGSPFQVVGTLSGTGNANRAVVLQTFAGGAWMNAGNPELTTAAGQFTFTFPSSLATAMLRVVTTGSPVVSSSVLTEGVAVRVNLHVGHTRRRGRVRLFGTVAPAQLGAGVTIQRLLPRRGFVSVGGTVVGNGSRFSRVLRVHRRGLFRVFVAAIGGYAGNFSNPVLIR